MKRIFSLIALTAAMFAAIAVDAAALSETDAGIAASRWARRRRLGIKLSPQRTATRRYTTQDGNAFYGVRLGSSGTVFVADVGGKGSVLAFTRQPLAQIDEASPLYALISRDLAAREGMTAGATDITADDESDIDDLRVMPFVRTRWDQGEAYSDYDGTIVKCYNYYTPTAVLTFKFEDGTIYIPEKEYSTPCGCVATAMAQAMRYWQHPSGRSSFSNTITHPVSPADVLCVRYNGTVYYTSMEMTNELVLCEQVTSYSWNDMIECPLSYVLDEKNNPVWSGDPVNEAQCMAIGGFTYDCGVSVGLEYSPSGTGLYTSQMAKIPAALTNVFGYASAVVRNSMKNGTLTADPGERARAILTNLDAKRPVILLISGNRGGHAVVADGYGFVGRKSTPFVHLNMGWAGQCDVWYNLPSINVSDNPENFSGFDTIDGVVYNIAPEVDMVGEIVSGCAQPTNAAFTALSCRRMPRDMISSRRRATMWAMPTPGVSPSPAMKRSATAGATIFRWDCRRCASATDFSAASAMPSNLRSARASRLSRCCVPALLRETSPSQQTFQSLRQTPRRDSRPSSAAPIPPRSRLRMAPASRFPIS